MSNVDKPQPLGGTRGEETVVRGAATSVSRLLLSGGAWSLLSRFGQSFVMLSGTIVLARVLTPADFGTVALSTSLCVLMLVIAEGFIDYPLLRSDNLTGNRLQSLLWAGLALMGVLGVISALVAPLVEEAFDFVGLANVIRFSSLIFLSQTVMVTARSLLRRQHRFRDAGMLVIASAIVYVGTAVTLALTGWGVWSLVIGQAVSSITLAALLARTAGLSLRFPQTFDLKGVLRTGGMGLTARVLSWFWSSIDTIVVGLATSAAATGMYSRAYNLTVQLKEPFAALDHPVRQALTVSKSTTLGYETVFRETSRLILTLAVQAAVAVSLMSAAIVALILGPQWSQAAPIFALLVLGVPARIANNLLDGDAVVAGDMGRMVVRHILLALAIGSGTILLASQGIMAVATVVIASLYIPVFIQFSVKTGFAGTWRTIAIVLPPLASGAATYGIYTILEPLFDGNLLIQIASLTLIVLCVMCLVVWAICPSFRRAALAKVGALKPTQ